LVEPGGGASGEEGPTKTETFDLKGVTGKRATIRRVDAAHGDTLDAWKKMGSPKYPSAAQVEALQKVSEVGGPETVAIRDHQLTVTLPPMGLAVIEIRR
jgi:xylan 1,4-beta-xylosidase